MKLLLKAILPALVSAYLATSVFAQTQLYRLPTAERQFPDYFLADTIGWFEYGPAAATLLGHHVYVDRTGRVIAPRRGEPMFEEAQGFGANGLAPVRVEGKFGYINRAGEWVVRPELDFADHFLNEPHAAAGKDGKFGAIAADGTVLVPFAYESGVALPGFGFLLYDGKAWAIADRRGKTLTAFQFQALGNQLSRVSEGLIPAKHDERWGFASAETGAWVVPARYDAVGRMSEGLANFILGEKIGYVNSTGRVVVEPLFERADEFTEGLAAVQLDGRWGYIDKQGAFAIAPVFDRARKFHHGHALVTRGSETLTINRLGEVVAPPPEEPREDERPPDSAHAVAHAQRCQVRFDHLDLGIALLWDGKGAATEARLFRLDTNQTLVWDARLAGGLVRSGLFLVDGKLVVIDSAEGFRLDRLEQEVAGILKVRKKSLNVVNGGSTPEMKARTVATLNAIMVELKTLQTLEKTYFDRRHEVDLDASNEIDAAANRIAKARPYVDRLKSVSARIDQAILELDALNDDQRRLLNKIRDDAAEIAQQVLRLP